MVLLYNESTMDIFCNPDFVEYIKKLNRPLRIQINGGEMSINQKENILGCNRRVWFSRKAITNIIALNNITGHYRVTYYSNDHMSSVYMEGTYLPNM